MEKFTKLTRCAWALQSKLKMMKGVTLLQSGLNSANPYSWSSCRQFSPNRRNSWFIQAKSDFWIRWHAFVDRLPVRRTSGEHFNRCDDCARIIKLKMLLHDTSEKLRAKILN